MENQETEKVLSQLSEADKDIVDVATEEAPQKPLKDSDVVDMSGLFNEINQDSDDASKSDEKAGASGATETSPADEQLAPVAKDKKTYKVGKKEFESPEEMAAYIGELEKAQATKDAYNKGVLDAVTPIEPAPKTIKPADILFEDPQKAIELLRAELKAERDAEDLAKQNIQKAESQRQKSWNDFYNDNPDLKGWEKVVNSELAELVNEGHSSTDIKEGLKILAKRTRDEIGKFKQRLAPKEELPSGPAMTSGTTGADIPRVRVETKATSFLDELKVLRKRGA